MRENLDEIEFAIFDTETTGLEPQSGDRVVEIAALRFKGEEVSGTFQSLVNPHRPISQAAFMVNKITAQMLKGAADASEVIPKFLDFVKDAPLCSYNAGFDLGFLDNEIRLAGLTAPQDLVVIDILKMARRLMPKLERYALWFVANSLGFKQSQEHRALSDAELTFKVFNKLKGVMLAKGISGFTNLSGLFSINHRLLAGITEQKMAQIQEAIGLGVGLKIRYLSVSGAQVTEREVRPKEIRRENNASYLVAYCSLRNEERTFRVDGILHLEII